MRGGGARWWCAVVVRGGGARWWCAVVVRGGGALVVRGGGAGGGGAVVRWCGGGSGGADGVQMTYLWRYRITCMHRTRLTERLESDSQQPRHPRALEHPQL